MNCHEFLEQYDLLLDHEAGRGDLTAERASVLREHRESCSLCRWEIRRNESLSRAIQRMPAFAAPPAAVSTAGAQRYAARGPRTTWPVTSPWFVSLATVAATILVVIASRGLWGGSPSPGGGPLPRLYAVEALRDGSWVRLEDGSRLLLGETIRSLDDGLVLPLSRSASIELGEGATLTVSSRSSISLDAGRMSVWRNVGDVRPDRRSSAKGTIEGDLPPILVETPLAAVDGRASAFTVDVERDRDARGDCEQVRVAVSAGSVRVANEQEAVCVGPFKMARVRPGESWEVIDLEDETPALGTALQRLSDERDVLHATVRSLRREVEELRSSGLAVTDARADDPVAGTDSDLYARTRAEFDALIDDYGYGGYFNPRFAALVEAIRRLGATGTDFLFEKILAEDPMHRFIATMAVGMLGDVGFVDELEAIAGGDDELAVRRGASRALATMEDARAGEALQRMYAAGGDVGVMVNAWYGLARMGYPQAFASLARLFDAATSEVTEEMILSTVLVVEDVRLHPALREVYARDWGSSSARGEILRTLASDPADGSRDFLWRIAGDPETDAAHRDLARELLR